MRKFSLLWMLMLALLVSCGTTPPQPSQPAMATIPPVTFVDDLGREVTVESAERVAILIGSFADIWCLAGGRDAIVATSNNAFTDFDLGLSDQVLNLGGTTDTNMELLLASSPDLIIASSNTSANVNLLPTLEAAHLNVAYFNVSSFDDYLHMLDICTQITGDADSYATYGSALAEQIQVAKAQVKDYTPSVLFVRATGSSCKVKNSQNSVLGEMLADFGCVNIADSESGLLEELSMETILACDPDCIFLVLQGSDPSDAEGVLEKSLLSNPAWQTLTAVQEGRFYYMDHNLFNLKPNALWGDAYEQLADILCTAEESQ